MPTSRQVLIAVFVFCSVSAMASGTTLSVPGTYATISAAVAAASPGDTIQVAAGTYTGTGNVDISITKNLTFTAPGGAARTIINVGGTAANNHDAFNITGSAGSPITVAITGFTVENAYAGNGAMLIEDANVTISQCNFITNTAFATGAAMTIAPLGSTTTVNVLQSLFQGNVTGDLTANPGYGGAIEVFPQQNVGSLTVNITNSAFIGNTATADGGAIDIYGPTAANPKVSITNCSFSKNNAEGFFGAGTATPPGQTPGVLDSFGGSLTVQNSILYGDLTATEYSTLNGPIAAGYGSLAISYSDVQGGTGGIGAITSNNINADPKYVNPNSDLHLQLTSPAIDTANGAVAPSVDFFNNFRTSAPDMGAFEYTISVGGSTFNATAGTGANLTVATFSDSSGSTASVGLFTASISWGDATQSSGTVSQPGGFGTPYAITSSHTYPAPGDYTVILTVVATTQVDTISTTSGALAFVVNGPATHMTLSAPATATAGTPFQVTVTALSAANLPAATYSGTVHFTSGDVGPQRSLPADYTFTPADAGSHSFSVTLVTSGSESLSATDGANSFVGIGTVGVGSAATNHLAVSAPSSVTAGSAFTITVSAQDLYNNIAGSYRGTAHFSASTTALGSFAPANYSFTAGDGGVRTFTNGAELNILGSQTVTATDTVNASITGTSSGIQVINPQPVINSLDVTSALVNSAAFTLHISGSSFFSGATVTFNGNTLTPSSVTSTLITVTIPANLLTSAHTSVPVVVVNQAPAIAPSTSAAFMITQACTYNLSAATASAVNGAANGTVGVSAPFGCAWTAASNSGFLGVVSGTPGNGNGTVSYSVGANSGLQRTGTLTLAAQRFTVTQASGLNELDTAAATGSVSGVVRVPVTLSLASNTNPVTSLQFAVAVNPAQDSNAPVQTVTLSFQTAAGIPAPSTSADTSTLIGLNFSGVQFSGTTHLGDVLMTIPASAQQGQTYTVQLGGIGAVAGGSLSVATGANTLITVESLYTVSDVFPFTSNGAGFFGDASPTVNTVDLLETLRLVSGVEVIPTCSDRFDAADSFPVDTQNTRGGDGAVNTLDLLETLRRVSGIDASRPTRASRGACTTPAVAPASRTSVHPALAEASLEVGESRPNTDSNWQTPVYLVAKRDASWQALALSLEYTLADDEPQLSYFAGEGSEASLVDESTRGKLALAWLSDVTVKAGDRVLLGYVVTTSQPRPSAMTVLGASANAKEDGRAIRLTFKASR